MSKRRSNVTSEQPTICSPFYFSKCETVISSVHVAVVLAVFSANCSHGLSNFFPNATVRATIFSTKCTNQSTLEPTVFKANLSAIFQTNASNLSTNSAAVL